MNSQHNLPRRVIIAAAILSEKYSNSDVAAFNRMTGFRHRSREYGCYTKLVSERSAQFWHKVGRALGAAYGYNGGCRTDYEYAVRLDIEATRASLYPASA